METAVIFVNHFFDVLWIPLSKTPPYVDIVIISAISALLFLFIFKKVSNQEMIRRYKNKIVGHILQIRLYRDKPLLTLRGILSILGNNLVYLRYTLLPLIVIIIPVLLICVQLNNRLGYSPLGRDKSFIIRGELDKNVVPDVSKGLEKIRCKTSDGIILETPPMRILSEGRIFWRARASSSDDKEEFFRIRMNGRPGNVKKMVVTSNTKKGFCAKKRKWDMSAFFTANAEDFIPKDSPFCSITVNYDRATYPFLFWNADPIVLYFIFTLIFGFILKTVVKVSL